jgi:pimeloyl-ACP methyl ester carboxylesterase
MIFEKQVISSYKNMIYTRCDDTETVFYFSADDFNGLKKKSYVFKSSMGHTLQGYIYNYESPISNRLIVFEHGFGGGHRAYMKEIEMLCSHGYTVLAYDHTGCMESGGNDTNGMSQSLCDLNDCINTIKKDKQFSGYDISVIGHSWGGFSTLNISALHSEISHIVALSGFVSVEEIVNDFFSSAMKPYRKSIMKLEREANPDFVSYNAVESLKSSNTKALLIYSSDDPLVKQRHYEILKNELSAHENISFMLISKKGHNPNYTEDAVKILGEFSVARAELLKRNNITKKDKKLFIKSFNWTAMTEQDEIVWKAIFEHLDK